MKKLLILLGLFIAIYCHAQSGIKLSGLSFISTSDSSIIKVIYAAPLYQFDLSDSSYSIVIRPAISPTWVRKRQYITISDYPGMPMMAVIGKSATGVQNLSQWLTIMTAYFQGLGFTVTTYTN